MRRVNDAANHQRQYEQRVEDYLDEYEGIRGVEADADRKRVYTVFNPHVVDSKELRSLIEELGYDVSGAEA